jgi:hypothetical protein
MQRQPEIDVITYLDADLFFYSSPQPVFDELADGSVLIVPHRFPDSLRNLEEYGVFNVGLLSFRNDARGLAVLNGWREQCLEWCYDRVEDGRFADQRYLDAWPGQPGVVILQNPGAGLAPWNVSRYRLDLRRVPPGVDGHPLVFYHFQGVKEIRPGMWDVALDRYGVNDRMLRSRLYRPYVRALRAAARLVRASRPITPLRASSVREREYTLRQVVGRIRRRQVILSRG